ncbi:MAG: TolC family protein [Planctomycetota bacterium]|jgi:outer membrane protein TolC
MKRILFLSGLTAIIVSGLCGDCPKAAEPSSIAGSSKNSADSNAPVRLQDYLRLAALNNAGLRASFEEWKAALEQVRQARALPDPKFTYGYYIREVETRVGPQRNRLGIMQVFPWFGEIEARTDAAAAAAKAARQRYEASKLKLFFEVKEGFYEYSYLARAVEIARENLELIKHFEQVARTKYIAAAAGHPDVIRAQMELATLEDRLKTLEDFRSPIAASLNALLNRTSFEALPWPHREEFQHVEVSHDRIAAILKRYNPELQELDFEIESSRSKLEVAKKKFYPDIGVGVQWIDTGERSGVRDSGKDPIILMFSMNLPIWRESYKAAELQAQANVRRARQQKIETQNTIIARTERVLYDFEDSARKVRLYADVLVPKAQELLSVSETAYKGGTVDFLSLIDAQRMLLGYQLNYERAVTDNLLRLAELETLAGAELSTAAN